MGGGGGERLFPLTRDRATAAVPIAGNYRMVDIPISNCINSGLRRIFVLTQFNTASLHRHVSQAYKFDHFKDAFVEIRAAQQTFTDSSWYRGTADAVRKNLIHFLTRSFDHVLILSADQLYRQDFRPMLAQHLATRADLTIGAVVVPRAEAFHLGILQLDHHSRVEAFVEKPADAAELEAMRPLPSWAGPMGVATDGSAFLASAGIYVFSREGLRSLLANDYLDFGKDILPGAVLTHRVFAFRLDGYWRDIGAVRSFFESNLELVSDTPPFNFLDLSAPIFTQPLYLPGAKVNVARINQALLAAGCIIDASDITHSIIGLRTIVGTGCHLERVISLGADYYESPEAVAACQRRSVPRVGIGQHTRIENAIIDRNARIGDNVVISPAGKPPKVDHQHYVIRDGIVIIPRNGIVPHGTVV
jgi:glucose-1-phosphate adenylyltransferase